MTSDPDGQRSENEIDTRIDTHGRPPLPLPPPDGRGVESDTKVDTHPQAPIPLPPPDSSEGQLEASWEGASASSADLVPAPRLPDVSGLQEWFANASAQGDDTLANNEPDPASRLPVRVGDRFAGHTLEKVLGRGGMGAVFVGVDDKGVRRAVKVSLFGAQDDLMRERFRREVAALAKLPAHPNVLGVWNAGEERGYAFCATALVEGTPLDQLLKQGDLPVERALALVQKLASALGHIHEHGIVHRDIKPANVLIRESDGEPVIIDFGIARSSDHDSLTKTGDVIGSPHYMSPEQAVGSRNVDRRSDVFSLGSVLYELLTGEVPFRGASAVEIMAKILREDPPAPSTVRPGLPPGVDEVVLQALEKSPHARFSTAVELAAEIARVRRGEGGGRLTRPMKLALVAIVAGALTLLALVFAASRASKRAAWARDAKAHRAALDSERQAFRGVRLGLGTPATSPVFSGTTLESAEALLDDRAAPGPGQAAWEELERSCVSGRAEASLARGDLAAARVAARRLPEGDPERVFLELLAGGSEPQRVEKLLALLPSSGERGARLPLEVTLAAARAEVAAGKELLAVRRLDGTSVAAVRSSDSPEGCLALALARRLALVAAVRKATKGDEVLALFERAREDEGEGSVRRAELVDAVLGRADAASLLHQVGDRWPELLARPKAVPVLLEWARESAEGGDLPAGLGFLADARALDPACTAPLTLRVALDEQSKRLLDPGKRSPGDGKDDEWLGLVLAAVRAGFAVDARRWPRNERFGLKTGELERKLQDRAAADPADWAAKLCLLGRLTPPNLDEVPVPKPILEQCVRLEKGILKVPGLPRRARAFATEAGVLARTRLAVLQSPLAFMGILKDVASELEKASELGGPGRARCLHDSATLRFFGGDREGAFAAARRALTAADERRAPAGVREADDESVLDQPWREDEIRAGQLEARSLLVFLTLARDESSREPDAWVSEMKAIDEEGDRAGLSSAYLHLVRGENDAGLADIRTAYKACVERTGEKAAPMRERYLTGLDGLIGSLHRFGHGDEAALVERELKAIKAGK